jgi:hypothetical protein
MKTQNSSSLYVHGYGSVSSAGMDSQSLYAACQSQSTVDSEVLERIVGERTQSYRVKRVDAQALRKLVPKHPRLRRSSPISKFAMVAAMQALGEERVAQVQAGGFRLGIVVALFNGCIGYSNRFYKEVLDDPKLASPILFPETVFNAPASHVASYLGSDGPVYSLIGDTAAWFSAMRVAGDWLDMNQVDGCLVIGAEEIDWLSAEGLRLYSKELEATEGAAAVYLEKAPSEIALDVLSGPYDYTTAEERKKAMADAWMESEVPEEQQEGGKTLLVDGLTGDARFDRDEKEISSSWAGPRMSPAVTLGYGMGSMAGFQTVAALEAVTNGFQSSLVMASGTNQHAFAARFSRV